LRDAPEEFQGMTDITAKRIKEELPVSYSDGYIDDFLQHLCEEKSHDVVIVIQNDGWILGKKKLVSEDTTRDPWFEKEYKLSTPKINKK
jgi:hypothetical protein